MRLISVHLKAFRLHADSYIAFPPDGISGLISQNEGGKTTVLEAVTWALFGAKALRGSKGSIRWNRAPSRHGAEVVLGFEIAGRVHRLHRTESSAKLWQEWASEEDVMAGPERCIAEGTRAVDEFVPTLLGMALPEFTASFLCQQKDVARLAAMAPTERVSFIRRVLGLEKIDVAVKAAREKKGELGQQLAGMEAGLGERGPLEHAATDAEEDDWNAGLDAKFKEHDRDARVTDLGVVATALAVSTERKAQHDRLEQQVRDTTARLTAATFRIETLSKDAERQQDAAARVKGADFSLAELPALREEQRELIAARERMAQVPAMRKRMEQITAAVHGPAGIDETLADARKQLTFHDPAELAAANTRAGEADRILEKLRDARLDALGDHRSGARSEAARISALTEQLQNLLEIGASADCPTCTRPLAEHFDAVCAVLERESSDHCATLAAHDAEVARLTEPSDDEVAAEVERDAAEEALERLVQFERDARLAQSNIDRLTADRAAALGDVADIEQRIAEASAVPFDPARLAEIDQTIQQLEQKDRALAADRGLAAQLDATRAAIDEAETEEADASTTLDMLAEARHQLGFDPQAHAATEAEAGAARKALEEARVALARAEAAHEAAQMALDKATAALTAYDRRAAAMANVRRDHHNYVALDERMGAFRTAVAGAVRPELEELASGFVHVLTDGRHDAVTLSEDFAMTLHESGVPVEIVSGGCDDVAALAMRLALSQLIAQRAGHDLGLLVLDEVFGSLDETRRANVLGLLRRLSGVFPQILLISHVAETRDSVDHVVELEYDEAAGRTRVVGAQQLAEV